MTAGIPVEPGLAENRVGQVVEFDLSDGRGRAVAVYTPGIIMPEGAQEEYGRYGTCHWVSGANGRYTLEEINAGNPKVITPGLPI